MTTDDAYVGATQRDAVAQGRGLRLRRRLRGQRAGQGRRRASPASTTATTAWPCRRRATRSPCSRPPSHRLGKQIAAQQAAVDQAKAQLASAKAGADRADLELKRQQDLATRQINSRQQLEQAQANYDQAVAAVQAARGRHRVGAANVDVLKAQQEEAERTLEQLQTALAKAERDLSFTVIRAPFDGVVGNRAVQVGDYVQPTQRLASLVPLEAVYIDANFKETQVAQLQPGQPVAISGRRACRAGRSRARWRASRRPPARCSRCCRPTTPPATSPRSCSACRCASWCRPTVAEQSVLRPGMSVVVKVNTKPGAPAARRSR